MRYNKIRRMDISNGLGIRVSLFVQGCDFHCPGCFNPETWDFSGGKEFCDKSMQKILELCDNDKVKGLSILGGEPLHPNNRETVVDIMRAFKFKFPKKDIWLWTGYEFEDLWENRDDDISSMMIYLDYLIDGHYEESKRDLRLKWAGSFNQRCIDIQKTLKEGHIVTLDMLDK